LYNNKLKDIDFVAFDLETTGLSPFTSKIIEIGAIKFRNK
jgi:DNA polymerase-3 subunit alpha (Gram-positive type)